MSRAEAERPRLDVERGVEFLQRSQSTVKEILDTLGEDGSERLVRFLYFKNFNDGPTWILIARSKDEEIDLVKIRVITKWKIDSTNIVHKEEFRTTKTPYFTRFSYEMSEWNESRGKESVPLGEVRLSFEDIEIHSVGNEEDIEEALKRFSRIKGLIKKGVKK